MTYPSTEGCKWVFSGGPKPPAPLGKRVLQCRLWLRSFTMGRPHIKAYPTLSRTLSIRVAEKENMWTAFQRLPLKMVLCYLHSHFPGQSNLQGQTPFQRSRWMQSDPVPRGRELEFWPALRTIRPACIPQRGCEDRMNQDMKVFLKTASALQQWVLLFRIKYHTTENIQDLCHTKTQ